MYPGPGISGCSYTGSTGGAIVTDTNTPAFDTAEAVSVTIANTSAAMRGPNILEVDVSMKNSVAG
jgi:hypothetical protein